MENSTNNNTAPGRQIDAPYSVLVVDDEPAVATFLRRGISYCKYDAVSATSGVEALERLCERHFDVMLTDIHMPMMRGDELQRFARQKQPNLIVLLVTASQDLTVAIECMKDGCFDYITKPFELADVVARIGKAIQKRGLSEAVASFADQPNNQTDLKQRVAELEAKNRSLLLHSMESIAEALEAKIPGSRSHAIRVSEISYEIALKLRPEEPSFAVRARLAAVVHDFGMIAVSDTILQRARKLNSDEWENVEKHTISGEAILEPLIGDDIVRAVRSHHERWDGQGYPDRLRGENIPLAARIISVADAYCAMIKDRPYRDRINPRRALAIIEKSAGEQWDPAACAALLELAHEGRLVDCDFQDPVLPQVRRAA